MGGLASSGDIALSRDSWRPASTAAWRSALLLVGGTTVALQANRGGRRRESRAWMTKAHVEGHVDTASIGGEVEGGIPASRPNVQELCQGSLDEVEVVHLKRVEQEGEVRVPSSQARVTSLKSRSFNRALTA